MPRPDRTLVWTGAAIGVVTAVVGMGFWATGPRGGGDWAWSLCVALLYGPAGALLVDRAPRLAAVLATMGLSAGLALLAGEHAEAAAAGRADGWAALSVWVSSWSWVPAYVLLLAVVPHLLPDGTLPTRLTSWGYRAGLAAATASTVAWLLSPYDELDEASAAAVSLGATNPVGIPGMGAGVGLGLVLVLAVAGAGVPSLVMRWRRTRDRQALAWSLTGFTLTAGLLVTGLLTGGHWSWVALAALPLPVALLLGAATRTATLSAELRAAQARLAITREEERRRLRHDLHDSLGPALAGIALQLEGLPADIEASPARAAETATRLTGRVRASVDEVRRLVDGLGPETSLGLAEGLSERVAAFDTPERLTTLSITPGDLGDLPAAVEAVALRVVGESLTNMARHSGSDRCEVAVVRREAALVVTVRDHGRGLEAGRVNGTGGTGVGLVSMRAVTEEIGGSCTVTEVPGGGTEVRVELPVGRR